MGGLLDPKKPPYPPWHSLIRYLIPARQNHERNTNTRKLKSIIKVGANNSNSSEKQTHADISNDHKKVEYEECSRIAVQSRHEVDENTETENVECREGEINPDLGYPEGGGTVEGKGLVFV